MELKPCNLPIVSQTSTYTFRDTAELIAYQEGRYGSYEYGRYGNPTTRAVEEKIRVRREQIQEYEHLRSRMWERIAEEESCDGSGS